MSIKHSHSKRQMVSTDTWGYLRFRISAREWGMWWTSAAPTVVVISQCAPVQNYYSTSETGVNLWQLYRDKHVSIHNFLKGWGRKILKSLLRIIETQCSRSFAKDNSRSFAKDLFIITVITTANMCWASCTHQTLCYVGLFSDSPEAESHSFGRTPGSAMKHSNCSTDAKSVPKSKSFTGRENFMSKILEEIFSVIQEH